MQVELYICLRERARRNVRPACRQACSAGLLTPRRLQPCFLRRTLKYRAPARTASDRRCGPATRNAPAGADADCSETFELALSASSPALSSSVGQAQTTVFVALCDASVRTLGAAPLRCAALR